MFEPSAAFLVALLGALVTPQEAAGEAGRAAPNEVEARESGSRSPEARGLDRAAAERALDQLLCHLVSSQRPDGSWCAPVPDNLFDSGFPLPAYAAYQQAAHAVGLLALMEAPPRAEREAALEAGLDWLCRSTPAVRASDWDVDSTWGSLYGFVACVRAAADPRFQGASSQGQLERAGLRFYADLERRQTPDGGWAYYDDRPYSERPKWATSFCTALVLPALLEAEARGWAVDTGVARRARRLVRRCALPNGAYAYSFGHLASGHGGESIDQVPGSLGRIQVCQWALARAGDPRVAIEDLRAGLERFFDQHAYLDLVRLRPLPHEGWFANAGYFYFFGHYYAALAIELLPAAEREPWRRQLRHHVAKTITADGSCNDFPSSSFMTHASTSFAALALVAGLPPQPEVLQ